MDTLDTKDKQLNNRKKKRRRQENNKNISTRYKTKSKLPYLEVLSTNYAISSLILRLWARQAKIGKGYKLSVFLILFRRCVYSVLTIMPMWRSKDNLQELVLCHMWIPGITLGLVISHLWFVLLTCFPPCLTWLLYSLLGYTNCCND